MSVIFKNKSEISGTVTNTSYVHSNILNLSRSDAYPCYVEGYLKLSSMAINDAINIIEEVWVNGSFVQYEDHNLSNVQSDDALHFSSKYCPTGIYCLKMNQSFGTSRDFDYHFIVMNVSET